MQQNSNAIAIVNEGVDQELYDKIALLCTQDNFTIYTGIQITRLAPGVACAEAEVEEKHLNPFGIMHGGLPCTLADLCMGMACLSIGVTAVTISMNISFMASCKVGQKIVAEAKIIRSGKTMKFIETVISNSEGKLIAKASSTFSVTGKFG